MSKRPKGKLQSLSGKEITLLSLLFISLILLEFFYRAIACFKLNLNLNVFRAKLVRRSEHLEKQQTELANGKKVIR